MFRLALLALTGAMLTPGVAAAQQPPELRVGRPATGSLASGDPVMISGYGPFHVYRLDAREGDRLVLTLRSGAFDALLTLLRPVGGIHEVVGRDDDSGGGTDARLRWRAPATGTYLVVAQALARDGRGGYTLMVDEAPPPAPLTLLPIRIGESRHGSLTEASPLLPDDEDGFHDLYAFDAAAGQELVIALDSDDFDAYLSVGRLHGTELDILASDDDGGDGRNARLRFPVPGDGRYGIQARALRSGDVGAYTLTVREAPLPAPRPLEPGRDVQATLHGDGLDRWLVNGTAGQEIRIEMRSDDFDTVLAFGRLDGGRFGAMAENDDADDGTTNSRIVVRLPATGAYVVRASAFGGGAGRYTLRVDAEP